MCAGRGARRRPATASPLTPFRYRGRHRKRLRERHLSRRRREEDDAAGHLRCGPGTPGRARLWSKLTGSTSPLTRDFLDIGRVSYYSDTTRMRAELLPVLHYPTIREGRQP